GGVPAALLGGVVVGDEEALGVLVGSAGPAALDGHQPAALVVDDNAVGGFPAGFSARLDVGEAAVAGDEAAGALVEDGPVGEAPPGDGLPDGGVVVLLRVAGGAGDVIH